MLGFLAVCSAACGAEEVQLPRLSRPVRAAPVQRRASSHWDSPAVLTLADVGMRSYVQNHRRLLELIASAPALGLLREIPRSAGLDPVYLPAGDVLINPLEASVGPPPRVRIDGHHLTITDSQGISFVRWDRRTGLIVETGQTGLWDLETYAFPPYDTRRPRVSAPGAEIQAFWEPRNGILIVLDSDATAVTALDATGRVRWRHPLPRIPGMSLEAISSEAAEKYYQKYRKRLAGYGVPLRSLTEYWSRRRGFRLPERTILTTDRGREKFDLSLGWCDLRFDVETGFIERHRD